jgi:protein tyrosine phosphatase
VEEEFQRLGRSVVPPQFKAANMNCNKQKNRYANVLPYDDTRVKLCLIPGAEGSDYINANYIDGYMKKKAFIATQAPIPDTISDFWRMVWQESSLTIVMLSNEMENGRVSLIVLVLSLLNINLIQNVQLHFGSSFHFIEKLSNDKTSFKQHVEPFALKEIIGLCILKLISM